MNLQAFGNRDRYVVEVDGCVIEDDGIPLIDEFEAHDVTGKSTISVLDLELVVADRYGVPPCAFARMPLVESPFDTGAKRLPRFGIEVPAAVPVVEDQPCSIGK